MRIMNLSERKIIGKIPGLLLERPNSEKQGYIENLNAKTKPELLELLERQEKLLNNKSFISKLPDKGTKIKAFHDKIQQVLKSYDVVDETCAMLSNLELSKKYVLEDLEWGKKGSDYEYVDSDDEPDEKDPLKIIAQTGPTKKIVKKLQPEVPLITKEDIKDIEEAKSSTVEEPHVKYLIDKEENSEKIFKNVFKPYKSTISDVHNPFKEASRKRGTHWEITAATPPPSVHGPVKTLSLHESLVLQEQQSQHRKEVEMQHAREKLMERIGTSSILSNKSRIPSSVGSYRTANAQDSDDEASAVEIESDNEVVDEDEDLSRTMSFTISEWVTTNALEQT